MKRDEVIKRIKETLTKPMVFSMLTDTLKDIPTKEVEDACRHMICETGEMEDVNAWLRMKPKPLPCPETMDDLQWLLGTGRYAQ
jgi:hypothetical protein